MKIKEYDPDFNINKQSKAIEEDINLLLRGKTLPARILNYILKYLGYDDEEMICMRSCYGCPYFQHNPGTHCSVYSNNYVRNLISRKRNSLEDML